MVINIQVCSIYIPSSKSVKCVIAIARFLFGFGSKLLGVRAEQLVHFLEYSEAAATRNLSSSLHHLGFFQFHKIAGNWTYHLQAWNNDQ